MAQGKLKITPANHPRAAEKTEGGVADTAACYGQLLHYVFFFWLLAVGRDNHSHRLQTSHLMFGDIVVDSLESLVC